MLRLNNIHASYHPGNLILKGIDLELQDGEKVVILGRNGAGKTTLANAIFGLVPRLSGEITYRGKDLRKMPTERISKAGIGYFMQGAPVFPQLTVGENLLFAMKTSASSGNAERLESLGLSLPLLRDRTTKNMPAGSLSGGERSQLAIAMAVVNEPSMLILDEPFAGLSPANTGLVLKILDDYHKKTGAAMMLIAQDRHSASEFSSKQLFLRNGILSPD